MRRFPKAGSPTVSLFALIMAGASIAREPADLFPGLCQQSLHHTRDIQAYAVHEQGGFVWASLAPVQTAPTIPPPTTGFKRISHQFQLQAKLIDALENFLDGTHTHVVHGRPCRSALLGRQTERHQ